MKERINDIIADLITAAVFLAMLGLLLLMTSGIGYAIILIIKNAMELLR